MTYLFYLLFAFSASASIHPLSGSSFVNNLQSNVVFSQLGFKVSSIPKDWVAKNISDVQSESIEIGPNDPLSKTVLSFHNEKINSKINLESYVRQHLRDYNQYGFEVIGLQNHSKSDSSSIIVDLTQKNKKTKSRQVFFQRESQLIIASCLDDFDRFEQTITICNQILGSFQWKAR